jgi:hypothetical protein
VVKDRHQRREEDDDGQHVNREDDAFRHVRQRPENHVDTSTRVVDYRLHATTDTFDRTLAPVEVQNEGCNRNL